MPPSVKTMMPTNIEPSAPAAAAGPSNINIREFVADDDAANFGSALWKTIDQSAFVLAQREALEAFNFAKALRLSEETAAEEAQKRQHSEACGAVSASVAAAANPDAPAATPTEHQHSSASAAQSQLIAIRQYSRRPSYSQDGPPASSIPRSLAADGVQPVMLENKPSTSPPSSSSFSPAIPIPPIKSSASSFPPSSYSYSHSKALSASSSGLSSASSSSRITKQPSQNLSLSTFSSSSSSAASSSSSFSSVLPAIQVQVVDSHHRIASSSSSSHSQISSSQSHLHSQSHSRASSHSNAIPASSSSRPHNRNDRIEQRSKREAEPSSSSSSSTLSTSQSQSHSAFSSSSASSSLTQSSSSSSSDMTTTITSTKRRRTAERQPSSSFVPSSTTSSTPASRNSTYITNNATTAPLVAPPISEPKKSSASARDVLLGHIMNPASASAAKEVNTSGSNATRMASATGNTNVNSVPTPLQEQAKHQSQSQSHSQPQSRLRRRSAHPTSERRDFLDLFTASRNCVRCGNLVVSPRSQPSYTHDPFSLPFSDLLHVTCSACGTNHCRGCFAVVRCPRHCTGGQSCAVRNNCCPDVRAIAIFEALSSFDCIYAAEAGFGSGSASGSGVAGKGKEKHLKDTKEGAGSDRGDKELRQAYLKQLISNSKDKDKDKARSMRRFEDAFVRTLRILCSWLQPPSNLDSSSHSAEEIDEKGVKHPSSSSSSHHSSSSSSSSTSTQPLHPTIAPLFAHSYLPEVMHLFLSTSSARDWVAHSETYHALLALLRHMFNHGTPLAPVLLLPLARIEESCGLREIVWDGGVIEWEWGKDKDKDATSVDNAKAKGTSKDKDGDKDRGVREVRRWEALGEVVKGLEKNTRPGLRSLVGRLQFTGTVEKVESLCEGISYLLLQQVVGGV